jgi:hypothetical protein
MNGHAADMPMEVSVLGIDRSGPIRLFGWWTPPRPFFGTGRCKPLGRRCAAAGGAALTLSLGGLSSRSFNPINVQCVERFLLRSFYDGYWPGLRHCRQSALRPSHCSHSVLKLNDTRRSWQVAACG